MSLDVAVQRLPSIPHQLDGQPNWLELINHQGFDHQRMVAMLVTYCYAMWNARFKWKQHGTASTWSWEGHPTIFPNRTLGYVQKNSPLAGWKLTSSRFCLTSRKAACIQDRKIVFRETSSMSCLGHPSRNYFYHRLPGIGSRTVKRI